MSHCLHANYPVVSKHVIYQERMNAVHPWLDEVRHPTSLSFPYERRQENTLKRAQSEFGVTIEQRGRRFKPGSRESLSTKSDSMPPLKLIDIGANLTDGMFSGSYHGKQCHPPDLVHVLQRAWDAGVTRVIVTGGSLKESREALSLADTDGRLFCTVGVHPTRCSEFEKSGDAEKHVQDLLQLTKDGIARGKVVAVGEFGLDYDRLNFCPAETQRRYFERQFEIAETTKLPLFLHSRAAASDFVDIVKRNQHRFTAGVVHSFTGTGKERDELLAIPNIYIGINGCSLKTLENLEVMSGIPVDRMMIETDSPYCDIKNTHAGVKHVKTTWPSKKKEKHDIQSLVKGRNEPCQIRQVLEVMAAYRQEQDVGGFARTVYENTCRIFFPHDIDTMADAVLSGNN